MIKKYTTGNIAYVEEVCPEGHTVIDAYHPSHTITPWDAYGNKRLAEYGRVLDAAGIPHVSLVTTRTNTVPYGTGPRGRVRFGDDMMPGTYSTAVPSAKVAEAKQAIEKHLEACRVWLHENGPMPVACR